MDLTLSPQLKEAATNSSTDVLFHRQLRIDINAEISYDRDRLNDIMSDCAAGMGL